jgi:hypothetical protein
LLLQGLNRVRLIYTLYPALSTLLGVALFRQGWKDQEPRDAGPKQYATAAFYFIKIMALVEESPPEVSL